MNTRDILKFLSPIKMHIIFRTFILVISLSITTCLQASQIVTKASSHNTTKINTFNDLLKRYGIENSIQRKYIEDSVKQDLQDEINKHIDTKLDVEVYLKSLDYLSHGEIKQANTYLTEEIGKKVLEWAVGGTGAKVLVAAWDFDKYVWQSVQSWAEKQDQQVFHDWLVTRVHNWRNGKDIWEMQTAKGVQRSFNLWWNDNQNKFGHTKMYADKKKYLADFEKACRNRYSDVAIKNRQAIVERENLKLAIRCKLFEIQMKIMSRQACWQQANRMLRRAGLETDNIEQIKKYCSDPAFRLKVEELARKNNDKSTLELDKTILATADNDIAVATQAADQADKAQTQGKSAMIQIPLKQLLTFQTDYRKILQAMFSNSIAPEEGVLALRRWQKLNQTFISQLERIYNAYRHIPVNDQAQRDRYNAEMQRIKKALQAHATALAAIRKPYATQAIAAYNSLRPIAAKLKKISSTPLHVSEYANQSISLQMKGRKIPADEARNILMKGVKPKISRGSDGLSPAVRSLVQNIQISEYQAARTSASYIYVIHESTDAEAAMNRLTSWIDQIVTVYNTYLEQTTTKFLEGYNADQDILRHYREIVKEFADIYIPQAGAVEYANGWTRHDDSIICRLNEWQNQYIGTERDLNRRVKALLNKRRQQYRILSNIVAYGTAMTLNFARERRLLRKAELLAADAEKLKKTYSNIHRENDGTTTDNITGQAIGILRSENCNAKFFNQMISHYQAVLSMLNNKTSGYKRVLSPTVLATHRLDRPPYEGWRRTPQINRQILQTMNLMIDNANSAGRDEKHYKNIIARCKKINREFDILASKVFLFRERVGVLKEKAEKNILAIQGALKTPDLLIKNIKRALNARNAFKNFVDQTISLQVDDDKKVAALLSKARATTRLEAENYLNLAKLHTQMIDAMAPYKGAFRHTKAIQATQKALDKINKQSSGVINIKTDSKNKKSQQISTKTKHDKSVASHKTNANKTSVDSKTAIIPKSHIESAPQTITESPSHRTSLKVLSIADAYVYAYNYRNWNRSNRGKYHQLVAGWHPTGGESRIYIKFDLSKIHTSKFNNAILKLYHFQTSGSNSVNLGIYRVTSSWNEGNDTYHSGSVEKTAPPGDINWSHQPSIAQNPIATFNPGTGMLNWTKVDITPLVKQWISGMPNYGLVIKPVTPLSKNIGVSTYHFASRERDANLDKPKGINKAPVLVLYKSTNVKTGHTILTDTGSFANPVKDTLKKAYQNYIATYNRLTDLTVKGKRDTKEGRIAYHKYINAKKKYNSMLKTSKILKQPDNKNTQSNGTNTKPKSKAEIYRAYSSAYQKYKKLTFQGKKNTPEAKAAFKEYKRLKKAYENAIREY